MGLSSSLKNAIKASKTAIGDLGAQGTLRMFTGNDNATYTEAIVTFLDFQQEMKRLPSGVLKRTAFIMIWLDGLSVYPKEGDRLTSGTDVYILGPGENITPRGALWMGDCGMK